MTTTFSRVALWFVEGAGCMPMRAVARTLRCGVFVGVASLGWCAAMAQTGGVTVRASASLASNVGPQMELRVNGAVVGSTEVRASSYQNYNFPNVSVPAGAKLDVVFNNDAFGNLGDRNLFVESVTVNGTTIASTAAGVVFDRGAGERAFDGLDVMPGLSTLYWNGALRFTVASAPVTPPPAPTRTLSLTVSGGGSVSSASAASCGSRCDWSLPRGSVINLVATPAAGYGFSGWSGACSGSGGCAVTLNANKQVTATFKPVVPTPTTHSLSVTINGVGGVGMSDGVNTTSCAASCSKTYNTGATVKLAASPGAGYSFSGWGGACSGSGDCTVTLDAARSVTATFVASKATLSVSVNGPGAVNSTPAGINCSSSCSASFNAGSTVSLTATPSPGGSFTGWSGACSGTGACTVTLAQASSVGAAFAAAQTGSTIALSMVPNRTSGVAPLAVFFDATATTSTVTTMPFHELKYTWNFGDVAGGATWKYGARPNQMSKNVAYGGVAGHVFETPGTYTVTLTAYDGTSTSSKTTTITVTDPNVAYSGTNTVCVANGSLPVAGANGCPAGAAVANLSSLQVVADNFAQQAGRRILLKRGDTWNAVPDTYFQYGGTTIGAYGTGAPPLIRLTAANTNGFVIYSNRQAINNFTLMDIDFVGAGGFGNVASFAGDFLGSNFLALRLRANGTAGIVAAANGVSVTDCDLQQLKGGQGYVGTYVANSAGVAIQGNRIYDATGVEHNIRTHSTKMVIANNSVYGPAATKQGITVRGTTIPNTHTWSGNWVEHIVVSDNDVDAGPNAGQLVELAPTNSETDERIRDVIFERNYVHGSVGTLLISEVSERATIRNNLFLPTYDGTAGSITVAFKNTVGTPPPTSHYIYNNSFYRPAGAQPSYNAVAVMALSGNTVFPSGTVVKNNLAYAPFATGPVFFSSGGASSVLWTLANNTSETQIKNTAPGFITPPAQLSDWKPTSGYAIGGGATVPVWDDFFAQPRSGKADMGAVQH